ncbi:FAD:protein FMN transferase [Blautia schinkii]|nr:FAD:protein FMN transferase [Blautia schinkii]
MKKHLFFMDILDEITRTIGRPLCGFLVLLGMAMLTGCGQKEITATSFKLNTIVKVTIYDSSQRPLLDECMALCDEYENIFSRTKEGSELYKLNHRELEPVEGSTDTYEISEPLAELLSTGLSYSRESQGAFDIAIAPLTSLWDFTSEKPVVPGKEQIEKAVAACSYEDAVVQGTRITLGSADTAFDLGAIAKGYIADKMKEFLEAKGVKSAIINLGGNVLCIGEKPGKKAFHIGIQKPFADRNETIATMDIRGKSVVSSGIYERYFEKDGEIYHHILDPRSGYPYDNDLVAVTIISDKSVDGDALSTTCFALGLEKGMAFAEARDDVQAIFITKDYQVHYTKDFQKEIPVSETVKAAD